MKSVYLGPWIKANKVAELDEKTIPKKLKHFYAMQRKEREMLQNNRYWVIDQF